MFKFFAGLATFLLRLYLPFLRQKKTPSPRDKDIIDLFYKKDTGLIIVDHIRMVIESFYWLKRLFYFDISKVESGDGILAISSGTFSYSGISFRLSRKILDYVKDKVDQNNPKSVVYYKTGDVLEKAFSGDWEGMEEFDEGIVDRGIRMGELFYTSSYILIFRNKYIEQGRFKDCEKLIGKLDEIAEVYENDNARAQYYNFLIRLKLRQRDLPAVLEQTTDGILFMEKAGFTPFSFSLKANRAQALALKGNMREAEEILKGLRQEIKSTNLAPYLYSSFLLSQFCYDLLTLKNTLTGGDGPNIRSLKNKAKKNGKKAVRMARKVAADRFEASRLMGICHWLCGIRSRALHYFKNGIEEADRLEARVPLARLYHEMGKSLRETGSGSREFDGINADQYLEKARNLYQELELSWDLEELEKLF
jgi:hypothetical protein